MTKKQWKAKRIESRQTKGFLRTFHSNLLWQVQEGMPLPAGVVLTRTPGGLKTKEKHG